MMNLAKKYPPRYTYEDYRLWEGDWELIDGVPYAMAPSPFGKHQKVAFEFARQLGEQLEHCPERCFVYPELDWIVSEDTVVRPDIMVVCKEVEEYLRETPELVVEVVSPGTAQKDERLKFELYEREGVRIYVLVYPDLRKVRAFRIVRSRYRKFFDSDGGELELKIKDCTLKVKVDKLW